MAEHLRGSITLAAVIEVVGIQASGVSSLPDELRTLVLSAGTIVGSPRLLGSLPAECTAQRVEWPRPLLPGLDALLSDLRGREHRVVALATGDPLDSGVGTTLIRRLGSDAVRVHPAVGSVSLARARMGWSTAQTDVLSLVSTPPSAVRAYLTPGRRLLLLSADSSTPSEVAAELTDAGWPTARMTVLGDLGTATESRHELPADPAHHTDLRDLPQLNIVAVELPEHGSTVGTSPGLPDGEFAHDGQLTKREIRACALAALRPAPDQLLWDLGAGAGSIAIEWALHHPRSSSIAVERHPERARRIEGNIRTSGAVGVRVVNAEIPVSIPDLPSPDAVFIGGGADAQIIDRCWQALRPGGRLVVHTVTLQTEQLVVDAAQRYGGTLRRIVIERAEPLGRYLSWKPARPVVEWAVTRSVAPDTRSASSPITQGNQDS